MGLEMSKRYSYSFHPMSAKLYEDIGYHGGIQAMWNTGYFLAIIQVLKILLHVEILTWKSMGKPKMWNISKTSDHRAKWMKIWDSGYYSVGYF